MKAIRVFEFGGPGVLQLCEVPDLKPPPRDKWFCGWRMGVNVHTYMRQGTYAIQAAASLNTPGSDAAGVVESVGGGVEGIALGDRVSAMMAATLTGGPMRNRLSLRRGRFARCPPTSRLH